MKKRKVSKGAHRTTSKSKSRARGVRTQRGKMSLPVLVIAIVVILAVVGGGFYFMSGKAPGGGSGLPMMGSGIPKVSESEFANVEDPLVRKHLAAQANAHKYRALSENTSGAGGPGGSMYEIEVKSIEDVNFHMKMTDGSKDVSDMITIGDTTYVKDFSDGKWWKQKKSEDKAEGTTDDVYTSEKFMEDQKVDTTKVTYKKLGEEACGSLTCHKYEEVSSEDSEQNRIFWFDTRDFLLRKDEMGFGEFKTATTYEYDNISISVPSPTKDVPEGKNIYEYMYSGYTGGSAEGMPSAEEMEKYQEMMKQQSNYQEQGAGQPTDINLYQTSESEEYEY